MRKEVYWAIFAGIIFGLIIAFGIYRIKGNVTKPMVNPTPTVKATSSSPTDFKLTLDKPQENDVIVDDKTNISGVTKSNSWIIVSAEDDDYISKSNTEGGFNQEINLIGGVNQLTITAVDEDDLQSKNNLILVHSPSFEKRENIEEATESGSTIRDKVEAKVEKILYSPRAYIGGVTDISEGTIQIRTRSGEIRQITTNEDNLTVTKDTGKKVTSVKFGDIAIGDFIVAMGYENVNEVLMAQRILITSEIKTVDLEIFSGKALDIIDAHKPSSKVAVYSFNGNEIKKIKLSNIKDEQKIVYVKDRTIFALTEN